MKSELFGYFGCQQFVVGSSDKMFCLKVRFSKMSLADFEELSRFLRHIFFIEDLFLSFFFFLNLGIKYVEYGFKNLIFFFFFFCKKIK